MRHLHKDLSIITDYLLVNKLATNGTAMKHIECTVLHVITFYGRGAETSVQIINQGIWEKKVTLLRQIALQFKTLKCRNAETIIANKAKTGNCSVLLAVH